MSNETLKTETPTQEQVFTIDGKDYKISELSTACKNAIIARQEMLQSRVRHEVELEKIGVLVEFYNNKIKTEISKKDDKKDEEKK